MEYEWYADVFFVVNLLMDLSAMLAAAVILNLKVRIWRCLVVCAAGVGASILLLLVVKQYLIYSLMLHLCIHPLMTISIFHCQNGFKYMRILLTVYLTLFVMGGVQNSAGMLFGNGETEILLAGILAAGMFCLYQMRRKVTGKICQVDLHLGEKKLTVTAFCDSGNLLRDPESGKPVCILQRELWEILKTETTERKEIYYHTISENMGKLEVVILDEMNIYQKGTIRKVEKPEIGLHTGELMRYPKVQMLLHSAYM